MISKFLSTTSLALAAMATLSACVMPVPVRTQSRTVTLAPVFQPVPVVQPVVARTPVPVVAASTPPASPPPVRDTEFRTDGDGEPPAGSPPDPTPPPDPDDDDCPWDGC